MIPDKFKKTVDDIDDIVMPFWSALGNSVVSMEEGERETERGREVGGQQARPIFRRQRDAYRLQSASEYGK